jgi:hypothetical protein
MRVLALVQLPKYSSAKIKRRRRRSVAASLCEAREQRCVRKIHWS